MHGQCTDCASMGLQGVYHRLLHKVPKQYPPCTCKQICPLQYDAWTPTTAATDSCSPNFHPHKPECHCRTGVTYWRSWLVPVHHVRHLQSCAQHTQKSQHCREAGLTVFRATNGISIADSECTVHPGALVLVPCSTCQTSPLGNQSAYAQAASPGMLPQWPWSGEMAHGTTSMTIPSMLLPQHNPTVQPHSSVVNAGSV